VLVERPHIGPARSAAGQPPPTPFFPMTNRIARVRELMKTELAAILQKDFEFGGALVTVHDVDLTPDL
jgi:ribosome-binding factor A